MSHFGKMCLAKLWRKKFLLGNNKKVKIFSQKVGLFCTVSAISLKYIKSRKFQLSPPPHYNQLTSVMKVPGLKKGKMVKWD